MILSIIVAMARNRVIGRDNDLPWYLPDDLQFFKRTTMGKPLIMGRKTYESIGRPLPGRTTIIITRNNTYHAEHCIIVHSLDEALRKASQLDTVDEVMISGGAMLYEQALPRVQRIYLTLVDADITGDSFFPDLDCSVWHECWCEHYAADERNRYPYSRKLLERKR